MAEQKLLSSQGTEVNKNSTSYTSVVSPQKKKKKKKEKKNKERVWGQIKSNHVLGKIQVTVIYSCAIPVTVMSECCWL